MYEHAYETPNAAGGGGPSPARLPLLLMSASAALGAVFAGVSTSDFANHLDRQMHSIHCSFIPGASAQIGESGCRAVMMSPYSSLFRESMWGGLPISLLAMAVFCYLVMRGLHFGLTPEGSKNRTTKTQTAFTIAATGLPVVMTLIYGYLAASEVGAMCKLCVGIYVTSTLCFFFAIWAHIKAPPQTGYESKGGKWARYFFEGVVYVGVLTLVYMVAAPRVEVKTKQGRVDKSAKGCGTLAKKGDPSRIFIPLGPAEAGRDDATPSVAVLDPLCPACRSFDRRLQASGLYKKLKLNAVLFPLDSRCNWMVKDSLHHGACTVSEAMLCDRARAEEILTWAFDNQEELRDVAKADENRLRKRVIEEFPSVKGCLNTPKIKNKLNKSLRWAVANALPVLTPQLFVGDVRVCDEDTDLGLEYAVAKIRERQSGGSSKKRRR